MQKTILNYRIIIEPDVQTGTKKPGFTAQCSTLGIADDGDTVEEALTNIRGAIQAYVDCLIEDGQPVPRDRTEKDIVTSTQIEIPNNVQFAF